MAQLVLTAALVPRRMAESLEPVAAKQQAAPQALQHADAALERTVVPVAAPLLARAAAATALVAVAAKRPVEQPAPVHEVAAVEQLARVRVAAAAAQQAAQLPAQATSTRVSRRPQFSL